MPSPLTANLLAKALSPPSRIAARHKTAFLFSEDYLEAIPHNYSNIISFEFTKITPFLYIGTIAT